MLERNDDICAVIVEPIMVNAGVYLLSPSYLCGLRVLCDKYQIALIFDEIQTAFGWLGTFFATSKYNVIPDILTLGKALSPGFPLAAILMRPKYDVLNYGEDEFTYGGHPLSCAVALQNIKILKCIKMKSIVLEKSAFILKLLLELQKKNNLIKEIRGEGLIWGIDFGISTPPSEVEKIYKQALLNGLILRKSQDGFGSSLVMKLSLIITEKEIREGFRRLAQSLSC